MEVRDEFDEILKEFRDRDPWQGSVAERVQKFAEFHQQFVNLTYLVVDFIPKVSDNIHDWSDSRFSSVFLTQNFDGSSKFVLVMQGRLSVITFLCLWQVLSIHATPPLVFDAYSVFEKYWPGKFKSLHFVDGVMVKK